MLSRELAVRQFELQSIDFLESEVSRAQKEANRDLLELIAYELTFRQNDRAAQSLASRVMVLQKRLYPAVSRKAQKPQARTTVRGPVEGYTPTDEQAEAIRLFKSGQKMKINAYAGTGKTSTLLMLAKEAKGRGLYIAFNRDIVQSSKKKFPKSIIECRTTNGLARGAVKARLKVSDEKLNSSANAKQLVYSLKLKAVRLDGGHLLLPETQAFLVKETLRHFMQGGDFELSDDHFPNIAGLRRLPVGSLGAARQYVVGLARKAWDRMIDPKDTLPLGHDGYLKLWCLTRPRLEVDFILLDEAQDTNGVMLDLLKQQDAQIVLVGDRYQQIYDWRGAVNAMDKMDAEQEAFLTTSFRFGREIAEYATRVLLLLEESRPLRGNPLIDSRIGKNTPDAILTRTNSTAIVETTEALRSGRLPHLVGGTDELLKLLDGVEALRSGHEAYAPELIGFSGWGEVEELAENGEAAELLPLVRLVNSNHIADIRSALKRTVTKAESDVVISTAHKAKGKEWGNVRLARDFLRTDPDAKKSGNNILRHDELRLYYVAVTRAQNSLEIHEDMLCQIG